eukprot:7450870-Karenia_brevis.AAC.1
MHAEAIRESQALKFENELLTNRNRRSELHEEKAVFEAQTYESMHALMEEKLACHIARDEMRESQMKEECEALQVAQVQFLRESEAMKPLKSTLSSLV